MGRCHARLRPDRGATQRKCLHVGISALERCKHRPRIDLGSIPDRSRVYPQMDPDGPQMDRNCRVRRRHGLPSSHGLRRHWLRRYGRRRRPHGLQPMGCSEPTGADSFLGSLLGWVLAVACTFLPAAAVRGHADVGGGALGLFSRCRLAPCSPLRWGLLGGLLRRAPHRVAGPLARSPRREYFGTLRETRAQG